MPYRKISSLPDSVQHALPKDAQEIYLEAYNNAIEQYSDPKKRRKGSNKEETAHKVAWSAVKKKYEKGSSGKWHKK